MTDTAHDERAQDLAEALRRLLDADPNAETGDEVTEAQEHAERLLSSLTYDTASSASSQNYIDTGVYFLTDVEPPRTLVELVMIPNDDLDPDDPEDDVIVPALRCPSCSAVNRWQEVDRSERWNDIEIQVNRGETTLDLTISQGDGDYETIGFRCSSCGTVCDMPEGADIQIDWS